MRNEITPVLDVRHHRIGAEEHFPKPPQFNFPGIRIAQTRSIAPRRTDDDGEVKSKIEESDDGTEAVEEPGHVRTADDVKYGACPPSIVKFKRHSRDHQKQKTGDNQEMQEAFNRHEAREPFVVLLRIHLGFPEFLRIVKIQVNRPDQPKESMGSKESKHAD